MCHSIALRTEQLDEFLINICVQVPRFTNLDHGDLKYLKPCHLYGVSHYYFQTEARRKKLKVLFLRSLSLSLFAQASIRGEEASDS